MEINLNSREKSPRAFYAITDNAAVWKPALLLWNFRNTVDFLWRGHISVQNSIMGFEHVVNMP